MLERLDGVQVDHAADALGRRTHDALLFGDIRFLDAPEDTIAFIREHDGVRLLAVFNFCRTTVHYSLPMLAQAAALGGHGFAPCRVESGRLELPGYGAYFARVPLQSGGQCQGRGLDSTLYST